MSLCSAPYLPYPLLLILTGRAIRPKLSKLSSAKRWHCSLWKPVRRKQLQTMATELNIAPETLQAAEQHWQSRQAEIVRTRAKHAQKQRHRRQQWMQYGLGSLLMVGIDIATAGTITWSIFPVLGWGLGVALGGCDLHAMQSVSLLILDSILRLTPLPAG